jgi:hypothetical protein
VEYGDVSVHGAAISQTWYPVLEKPLYRLRNGSLNPQRLLSKSASMERMAQSHAVNKGKHTADVTRSTAVRKNNRRSIPPKVFENNILEVIDEAHQIRITTATEMLDKSNDARILTIKDNDTDADTLGDIKNNAYFAALLRPKKKYVKSYIRNDFNLVSLKQDKQKRLASPLKNDGKHQLTLKNESKFIPIKVTMKITDEDIQGDDKISQGDHSIDDSSMNSKTTEGIQNILHTYQSSISANR